MSTLDFQNFRIKHMVWKTRLRSFLEGKGGLSEKQALSHKECALGTWLYGGGLEKYSSIHEMQELEKVHMQLHETVRLIVSLKNRGNEDEAEQEYTKIGPTSDRIIALLTTIEEKVKKAS